VLENLEQYAGRDERDAMAHLLADADVQNELVDAGDFFICASERQRDYWLGMLTSRGRVERSAWADDADLRTLIDVVPYGSPALPPERHPVLKGVHPHVAENDTVLLWSGGAWEWFDPMLVLDAFADAHALEPQLKLYFMGLGIEGATPDMPIAAELHRRAAELGLHGTAVIFGDWVPYDDRGAVLAEADAAVLATKRSAETRLAFRSRLLDHFWVGLPTIMTPGDVLADFVEREGAGLICPIGDRSALREAMLRIHREPVLRSELSEHAAKLGHRFQWSDNVAPLVQLVREPERARVRRAERLRLLDLLGIRLTKSNRGPVFQGDMSWAIGFTRGRVIDGLKSTRLYPFMRKVRRSKAGLMVWGKVPGE
jgi:glycosyltransferase involved in cell wall biosynthesis